MTAKHVTVATEIQAEVANKINRSTIEVTKLLDQIAKATAGAASMLKDGFSISPNIQTIGSDVATLTKIQTRLDMALEMADMVGLTEAQLEIAVTPVRAWFHTEA